MDGLSAIFELLAILFLRWRVGAATALALLAAILLAATVSPFGARCGIVTVILGFGAGLLWDVDASASKGSSD